MGLNFRKSFGSGPFRVTLSKKGMSASVGVKGARISKSTTGRTTSTLSIPGTGLYYTKTKTNNRKKTTKSNNVEKNKEQKERAYNMFDKFNLTEKEKELFDFILKNYDSGAEFSIHDVSAKGCVFTSTYYTNLYNKGLLNRPSKGKYILNIELLEKMVQEEKTRLAEEERKRLEQAEQLRIQKEKNKKLWKKCCKIYSIPCTIIGLLLWACEVIGPGVTIIGALMIWHGFRKNKTT